MKLRILSILLTLGLLLSSNGAMGQSVKELKRQRETTLRQLETTTKMLNETKKEEKATTNKLNLIGTSIMERQRLIDNINSEISALDGQIDSLGTQINNLQAELLRVKADYARLIREHQVVRLSEDWLHFVLSADNNDQMVRRLRYIQQVADYRRTQAARITLLTDQINKKNEQVKQHRASRAEAMQTQRREQENLERDKRKQQTMLNTLKKKEKNLAEKQKQHQKKASDLNRRIERAIAEEIRKAEEAKRKAAGTAGKSGGAAGGAGGKASGASGSSTAKPSSTKPNVETLTKEEKLLADNFESNKGRLPWPVVKGTVTGRFGVQQHEQFSHVSVNNKGIYIQTPKGAVARTVFDGVVTQCFSVEGSNNIVIVQHGNYRTVYSNLTTLYVKAGQKVKAKQNLGLIYTDPDDDNKTEMQFQLWQGKTVLNPSLWLAH